MTEFKIIGKSYPRFDGPVKASGETEFLADIDIEGCWIGGVVRSNIARGKLLGVKKLAGFDALGAVLVTAADIPGENFVAIVRTDYPALADGYVNYVSQAIALVAAPDAAALQAAMALVQVEIEPLPPIFTIEDSLAKKEIIWGEDNVIDEYRTERGDIAAGFAAADVVVEGEWRTGLHEQMYLETQGMSAVSRADGSVEVLGSMQCPFYVHGAVQKVLGLRAEQVIVRQSATGGAFGGKEDYPSILGCYAALLAWKSAHPVKIIYDRSEDILCTPKRHPSESRYKMGLTKEGKITALDVEMFLDSGAYTTLSRVVLQRTHLHVAGAYYVPNVRIHSRAMATNTPPTGAFRGFGAPQAIFAMERQMDLAAKKLAMNPLDIRLLNVLKTGDTFPYGQKFTEAENARAVLEHAAEMSDYRAKYDLYARQPKSRVMKGIGIAVGLHGGGFTGAGEDKMGTTAKMTFDGESFRIYSSSTEMGQGASTVMPMVAAEALGTELEDVLYIVPDTSKTPNTGPTVASRTTMYAAKAVQNACTNLKKTVLDWAETKGLKAASFKELAADYLKEHQELEALGTNIFNDGCSWDEENFTGDAYRGYAWIANTAEVEVETDTYEVTVKESAIAAEVGRAVNPMQARAQLTGGVLQGFGWAHIEDLRIDDKGRYTASHMSSYLVPPALDCPDWKVELLEDPCEAGCYGAKGIGELPANAGAPAFIAAVENAVGVSADSIPLTGEKLFTLLEAAKSAQGEN